MSSSLWPRFAPVPVLFRSQGGPMASLPSAVSFASSAPPLAPLFPPLCGLPLDSRGHHRAACSMVGALGRRGFAVESAGHGFGPSSVVDGLSLFQGAQLAVDTTLVSVLRRDGVPRQQAATHDGAVLSAARRRKERVYPEFTGEMGRTRLMVLAGEVGGRWSEESREFLNQLAKAKSRREPRHLRARARQVWRHRWASLLVCSAAKAFAFFPIGAKERPGVWW